MMRAGRLVATSLAVMLVLAGCTREPISIDLTFEEAALVTLGEMFRQYGEGADPFPETVTGDVVRFEGEAAWKLDAEYAVTVDGVRRVDAWMVWIVAGEGRQPIVARADGPADLGS